MSAMLGFHLVVRIRPGKTLLGGGNGPTRLVDPLGGFEGTVGSFTDQVNCWECQGRPDQIRARRTKISRGRRPSCFDARPRRDRLMSQRTNSVWCITALYGIVVGLVLELP